MMMFHYNNRGTSLIGGMFVCLFVSYGR